MIGRLIKGVIIGVIIGGLAAAVLFKGLGITSFEPSGFPLLAYASALLTGALVGLLAGKPIWAEGAWIEGLLKTFFGALLGAGGMFLARKFGTFDVNLAALGLHSGLAGQLPAVTLPAISTVLSVFYELDNTGGSSSNEKGGAEKGVRVAGKAASTKARVAAGASAGEAEEEDPGAARKGKK
jgi:hypothetical protein